MKQQKQVSKQEQVQSNSGYKSGDITKLAIILLLMMIAFILGMGVGMGGKRHDRREKIRNNIEERVEQKNTTNSEIQEAEEVQIELPPVEAEKPAVEQVDSEKITQ